MVVSLIRVEYNAPTLNFTVSETQICSSEDRIFLIEVSFGPKIALFIPYFNNFARVLWEQSKHYDYKILKLTKVVVHPKGININAHMCININIDTGEHLLMN